MNKRELKTLNEIITQTKVELDFEKDLREKDKTNGGYFRRSTAINYITIFLGRLEKLQPGKA